MIIPLLTEGVQMEKPDTVIETSPLTEPLANESLNTGSEVDTTRVPSTGSEVGPEEKPTVESGSTPKFFPKLREGIGLYQNKTDLLDVII
jgi:hypothetical protein